VSGLSETVDVRGHVMGMRSAIRRRITLDFEHATDANEELAQVRRLVYRADELVDQALRVLDGEAQVPTDDELAVLSIGAWAVGIEDEPSGHQVAVLLRMLADQEPGEPRQGRAGS
jgi:hypothetical protein